MLSFPKRLTTVVLATVAIGFPPLVVIGDDERPETLPGTKRLQLQEPLDVVMVRGIRKFAQRELSASPSRRVALWLDALEEPRKNGDWRATQREKLRTIIGAVDERVKPNLLVVSGSRLPKAPKSEQGGAVVHQVRWDVLEGVTAEGLLLIPDGDVKGYAVAIPDAAWTPEQFCGLQPAGSSTISEKAQLPRQLVQQGIIVLVPMLISRDDQFSGHPQIRYTNISHRELVYRMAFEMGRHIIGYELQKVLAAVDLLEQMQDTNGGSTGIAVCGVGDGGQLALYAAALDQRIRHTLVCGYFSEREQVWQQPIDRNIWNQLTSLGDAEIASLTTGNLFLIPWPSPEYDGPKPARDGRPDFAAPGTIKSPELESVDREFERLKTLLDRNMLWLYEGESEHGYALEVFIRGTIRPQPDEVPEIRRRMTAMRPVRWQSVETDPKHREKRQLDELIHFTQRLLHSSDKIRAKRWSDADRSSVEAWVASTQKYRDLVHNEMIGRLPVPDAPLNPRSRKVIDESIHVGYEIVLDVISSNEPDDPGVIAGGVLLLPKDLKEGDRRPVVVCQHGLEGTPMDTITTDETSRAWRAYKGFSTQLVKRGFIVYAPQNPYRGEHNFRVLQRMSNPLGRSLFSYIIEQHRRTLKWLATLPNVDTDRIAFYGLSYGGKTAVRIPPLLVKDGDESQPVYCLSICSADFNEWIRKNVSHEDRYSYVYTKEYEMFEWNMGHTAGYAELASLMVPRPFMVERGHDDGVAPDEWVAWEYAKVRRLYDRLGIGDRTEIEFFNGPHTINGQGTFDFLHRHFNWPMR